MFLTLMVIGLVGLVMMAIPAFGRHGHGHVGHHPAALGKGAAHVLAHAAAAKAAGQPAPGDQMIPADAAPSGWLRFVPSPRAVFTVLALYGAFGNALVEAAHLGWIVAALAAAVPALALERFLVTPLWNLLFRFQGQECSPLEMLLFTEARAVVPFRNGRGVVAVNRDGRLVQLPARLCDAEATQPVRVGDRLRIEDIDARRERVTVSVLRDL